MPHSIGDFIDADELNALRVRINTIKNQRAFAVNPNDISFNLAIKDGFIKISDFTSLQGILTNCIDYDGKGFPFSAIIKEIKALHFNEIEQALLDVEHLKKCTTCSGTCRAACSVSCHTSCAGVCQIACDGGCRKSCSRSCGDCYKCEGSHSGSCRGCSGDCSRGCEDDCEGICLVVCAQKCCSNCNIACSGNCANQCIESCSKTCSTNCGGNCIGPVSYTGYIA